MFPGLALARTIVRHEPEATVRFAGTTRGLETRVVPEAGFALDLLPILPLSRRLSKETLLAPFAAVNGTFAARRLLREHRFDVVCGMGGYVTLPVAVAARMEGVPVVLHEQNAVPGIANRLAARVASRIAVGVAAAADGLPARAHRGRRQPGPARAGPPRPGRPPRRGGGRLRPRPRPAHPVRVRRQPGGAPHQPGGDRRHRPLARPGRVQVLHACGRRDEADVRAAWAEADPDGRDLLVKVVPFVDRMDLAYAAADLAMTRAGAITMAELTAAAMPAVMVPLPHATADHQAANARAVAAAGGAVVVDDAALDGPAVAAAVAPLLADPDRLAAMAAAMRSQAHPDAAEELAALVVEASGRRTREEFLAEVAAAAAPIDREAAGWFESAGTPAGGPTVQRRVDRRTKRMEAYPPVDRTARQSGHRSTAVAGRVGGHAGSDLFPTPSTPDEDPAGPGTCPPTAAPPAAPTPAPAHPPTRTPGHERAGGPGDASTGGWASDRGCTWSGWAGPG